MTSEYRIPAPLQNTINNLTFLASTQPGDKIFFNDKVHIRDKNWFLRLKRYVYGESLDTQIKIIREIIELGLDSIKSYSDNVHYHRLVREFFRAREGLVNLRNTYLQDGKETGEIDNILYIMKNQLDAISPRDKKIAEITPPDYKEDVRESSGSGDSDSMTENSTDDEREFNRE